MFQIWTLGGLSVRELLRRTWTESWTDAVYGQAGRMAFYHFLAIFPCLAISVAFAGRVPFIGPGLKATAGGLVQQVLPREAAALIRQMASELQQQSPAGLGLLSVCATAAWAVLNGTWALVFGLNTAYEVAEDRDWWRLGVTIVGLAVALGLVTAVTLLLLFSATQVTGNVFHYASSGALRLMEWPAVVALLLLSFAIIYRFAPSLNDAKWKWSTPGSTCALVLWLASTFGLRFYFAQISSYHRMYGHLNTVVMLLLWLYFTNAAVLIGGEMNSEIEKAANQSGPGNRRGARAMSR